jgi:hypothetical protein
MAYSTINEIDYELQDCANMSQVMKYIVNKEDFLFTFDDYMNYINKRFNPEMDLSFMKYFMELCDKEDEFIIDHTKLKDYDIITNINTTSNILKCLKRNNLIEDEHYLVSLQEQRVKQGGVSTKKVYKLTPCAFKTCLMNSRNTSRYRKYYLFLEECMRCYDRYTKNKLQDNYDTLYNNIINKFNMIQFNSRYKYIPELTKYCLLNTHTKILNSLNGSIFYIENQLNTRYHVKCIYFINEENTDNYKIGYTRNIKCRVGQLQTGNHRKLIIYKTILSLNSNRLESYLHHYFNDNKLKNEWFQLKTTQIDSIASQIYNESIFYL